jgi:hypothetical protein
VAPLSANELDSFVALGNAVVVNFGKPAWRQSLFRDVKCALEAATGNTAGTFRPRITTSRTAISAPPMFPGSIVQRPKIPAIVQMTKTGFVFLIAGPVCRSSASKNAPCRRPRAR